MDEATKNRRWLDDLGRRHRVDDAFHRQVRETLDGHGLLDASLPESVRDIVEETYRREEGRQETYEESVRSMRDWRRSVEEVAEALRDARRILALVEEPPSDPPPEPVTPTPVVRGTDTVN